MNGKIRIAFKNGETLEINNITNAPIRNGIMSIYTEKETYTINYNEVLYTKAIGMNGAWNDDNA